MASKFASCALCRCCVGHGLSAQCQLQTGLQGSSVSVSPVCQHSVGFISVQFQAAVHHGRSVLAEDVQLCCGLAAMLGALLAGSRACLILRTQLCHHVLAEYSSWAHSNCVVLALAERSKVFELCQRQKRCNSAMSVSLLSSCELRPALLSLQASAADATRAASRISRLQTV